MSTGRDSSRVSAESQIRDFFLSSVHTALANQRVSAEIPTVRYVADLLTHYARSDNFYEHTEEGIGLRPLAEYYAEAVNGRSSGERARALRRLGDVALFVAGVFSGSLNRKVVDVDYYIAMGGSAYGQLSLVASSGAEDLGGPEVFGELSQKFPAFVDVLDEVGSRTNRDLMRDYEVWVRTGSARAQRRLHRQGVIPSRAAVSRSRH